MTDEKKFDEDALKFYEDNKEMIDRIIAARERETSDSEEEYLEEMKRRAEFEEKMRLECEAEKARRMAFDNTEKAYGDYRYGRGRTEEAFEEGRDHMRDFARRQGEYLRDVLYEGGDRARDEFDRGRKYFEERYEADAERRKYVRDTARRVFNDGFNDVVGPFCDPHFQKHLVGAGLEAWMALGSLILASPLPDTVKEAFEGADRNRSNEFCRKNEYCEKKPSAKKPSDNAGPTPIKIVPVDKENKE